jgi:hypothetical protein
MANIVKAPDVKTAGWDRALDVVVDRMLGHTSGVAQYVQKLRDQHPGISDDGLARITREALEHII